MSNQIVSYSGDSRQPRFFEFNRYRVAIEYNDQGEPWFDGPDVCRAIGIAKPSVAYSRLDEDEKQPLSQIKGFPSQNGVDRVYVSESGLYNLIFRSDKPDAKAFKKHVTSVVLPSIRKTGSYLSKPLTTGEMLVANAEAYLRLERQLNEIREQQGQFNLAIEGIHEELLDRDYYTVLQYCQKQHIRHTPALCSMWGKQATALSTAQSVEIKSANEGQFNVGRYHVSVLLSVVVAKPKPSNQMPLISDAK